MKHPPLSQKNHFRRQVYLLTCWQEREDVAESAFWRFSLETPRSGKHQLFTMLKEVMASIELDLQHNALADD